MRSSAHANDQIQVAFIDRAIVAAVVGAYLFVRYRLHIFAYNIYAYYVLGTRHTKIPLLARASRSRDKHAAANSEHPHKGKHTSTSAPHNSHVCVRYQHVRDKKLNNSLQPDAHTDVALLSRQR